MNLELYKIDKILDEQNQIVRQNKLISTNFIEFKIGRLVNKLNELNRLITCSKITSDIKVKELWVPYLDKQGKNIGRKVVINIPSVLSVYVPDDYNLEFDQKIQSNLVPLKDEVSTYSDSCSKNNTEIDRMMNIIIYQFILEHLEITFK